MYGIVGLLTTILVLLGAGELGYMAERVNAVLDSWSLDDASLMGVRVKSIIQNCLDILVIFLCRSLRVQIRGMQMFQREVDEYAVFIFAQYNSNRMLKKNDGNLKKHYGGERMTYSGK
jgi:hypothetical protein